MRLPPSDFAATFRTLIIPRLRPMVEARGLFVALDIETFSEAYSALMREACHLGAARLPGEHLSALDDWLGSALLAAIDSKSHPRDDRVWRDVCDWDRLARAHFAAAEVADAG